MNKTEFITAIAKELDLKKAEAGKALDSFIAVITKTIKKGEKITLPGFMTISKEKRKARNGRNPQTGKEIKIAAKNVVKIKVGKTLGDAIK